MHHDRGFSLIELMVAMTIGLMLLGGAASLFISNKRIYREQEELSRLQENGRFALEMLIGDIRMTGYVGCHDELGRLVNQVSTVPTQLMSYSQRVEGSESAANWLPGSSAESVASMLASTDGITVRYLDPTDIRLTTAMSPSALGADLDVASDSGADVDTIVSSATQLAIADCSTSDVFTAGDVTADSIPHAAALSKAYGVGAQIMRFVARRYYIRNGTNGPALWMSEWNRDPNGDSSTADAGVIDRELIEGVESMQVLYGVDDGDADTEPNSYVDAAGADAAGWVNVVSVRISLLMRTVDTNANNEVDNRTYPVLDQSVGPFGDQRRRRIFSATVRIRNNT